MPTLDKTLIWRGTNDIKRGFETVLRGLFSDKTIMDERFRYDTVEANSKIRIYRAYPQRLVSFPSIVLSADGYDASYTVMDEKELATQTYDPITKELVAETFTGQLTIPINFKIFAKSTDDREKLSDILVMLLRVLGRSAFNQYGGFNKIHVGSEDQYREDSTNMVYTTTITVEVQTDYTQALSADILDTIDSIAIKLFGQEKPGSPLVPLHPLT